MALEMTVDYLGVQVPNVYIKVRYIKGTKDSMKVELSYHASSIDSQLFNEFIIISVDLKGPNHFKQTYTYLKLPVDPEGVNPGRRDFSTAKDV